MGAMVLDGLEKAPHFEALYRGSVIVPVAADRLNGTDLLKGAEGYTYLCRLNCGGDTYTDTYGQVWAQDNSRYSHSWAELYILICRIPCLAAECQIKWHLRNQCK